MSGIIIMAIGITMMITGIALKMYMRRGH